MTNDEINKLLSMLDCNELENLKQYLLKELYINNNIHRQNAFEDYLINNSQNKSTPRICVHNNIQKFTNGISLYILNTNLLVMDTFKLKNNEKKFRYIDNERFNEYLSQILFLTNYDTSFEQLNDLYYLNNQKHVVVQYKDYNNKLCTGIFSSDEITKSKIILNDPSYYVSCNAPIIKAESSIGKAYILSNKK